MAPRINFSPHIEGKPKGRIRQLLGWLGDRERQLQLAVEAADLGMWHWNPATGEMAWSDRCRSLLGVDAEAPATLETFQTLIYPDDKQQLFGAFKSALLRQTAFSEECRIVLPDGAHRWLHCWGRAQYVASRPMPYRVSGVLRDVTAQHGAAEAWKAHRLYLQRIVQAAPIGVAKLDRQLCFLSANRAFVDGLRLGNQDLTGRHLYEVLPEIPDSWREAHVQALAGIASRSEANRSPAPMGPWIGSRGRSSRGPMNATTSGASCW